MKALLIAFAALACGAASAQQDAGSVCRSFCDTDAKQCRDGTAHPQAWSAASRLLFLHGAPAASPDKHEQARSDADRDRSAQLQQCGDARQACRQKCSVPAAAPIAASGAPAAP